MDQILAFFIATVLVSLIIPRLGPFLSLVASGIVYGLLSGMGPELIGLITAGLGRIFSTLAIVVFSGAVIAEYLRKTGAIDRIVSDLLKISKRGQLVSGLAGYLVSLPVMCSVTAYMILEPVVSSLGRQTEGSARRQQLMTAVSSIISFNLIYPSPVMVSLSDTLGLQPYDILSIGIPISILLFAIAYLYVLHLPIGVSEPFERSASTVSRLKAWFPLVLPMGLILLGAAKVGTEGGATALAGWIKLIGNPSVALLIGAMICLALAKDHVQEMIRTASRRSGIIMLDLCGAGAFGYVIAQSGFGPALYGAVEHVLPALVLPFLLASILQLAQGSRVVTVVVSAQILSSYPLDGLTLALLICAGAFMFSYISDPYFWLVKESTKSSMSEMLRGYTVPLCLLGLAAFAATVLHSVLL
jgi:GntP family gluconate:H+ symporter